MTSVLPNTATASILVVDDEGPNRYSVKKTLEKVGYSVMAAASGEEALEMIKNEEFDVILTDIRMQGIDGVELLRRIKDLTPDTIVILMTGYASLGTAVEALRLGAHDYLIKPSSSMDIRQSVSRGIEKSRGQKRRRRLLETIKTGVFELVTEHDVVIKPDVEPPVADIIDARMSMFDQVAPGGQQVMHLGPLTVYPGRYQISVEDRQIDLTPTEFDLLLYLAAHRGRVVPCHELVREVRGYGVDETEAREVIRPHVSNLRRKLKSAGQNADIIVNVRGIGYRLSERAN